MNRTRTAPFVAALILAVPVAIAVRADNWPQFRGPSGQGVSAEPAAPTSWSRSSNIRWKTALPGAGHSSPIVWGDRVFLTAFRSESGIIRRYLQSVKGQLVVLSFDLRTGRVVWERTVNADGIEEVHPTNSPASPTPATDGQLVYVYFGSRGLVAFDFSGRQVWEKRFGPFPNDWGSASSPVLYGDVVLLNVDTDADDFLLAVDKRTGKTIWRTSRAPTERAWPTPVIWPTPGGDEIVVSGSGRVIGYDPKTGRELWRVDGLTRWVSPTPIVAHGLLYVTSNGPGGNVTIAIKPGGRGNVTASHVAWRSDRAAPYIPSPLVVGDYLFTIKNGGVMTCLNAKTGKLAWQERLPTGGDYYASPVAAAGRIYTISEDGVVSMVAARPAFQLLGTVDMAERTMASPAISGGMLLIRTDETLYAIGK